MLSNYFAKVRSKGLRSCSFSCATAMSEGVDGCPKCHQAVVNTTDRHRPKAAKPSPRSKSSRLLLLAQRKENKGVRASKKTKSEKSRKRRLQHGMMKIQQSDEMPNSENEKHRKIKRRRLQSHPDCELVLVETARVSQIWIVHPSKNYFYFYSRSPSPIAIIARVFSRLEMTQLSPHQIPAPCLSGTEQRITTYHWAESGAISAFHFWMLSTGLNFQPVRPLRRRRFRPGSQILDFKKTVGQWNVWSQPQAKHYIIRRFIRGRWTKSLRGLG